MEEEAYLEKFLQKFQHLKIQLEEVKEATNNFTDKPIGVGSFGYVYRGEVSHSEGRGPVAVKRLVSTSRQGVPEFLKEITMLSDCKHENVISLLGFCHEERELILVYEIASLGSLDRYLHSPDLTWGQRLKICLDAAKGLRYLHDPRETHRRLIHCDVKSGNILLDDKWNAKVSDLGLAQVGSANEQHSVFVTLAAGTVGYIDPQYLRTHTLTKESDVYSFGVVLFEVLRGRVCYTLDSKGHVKETFVRQWKKSYEQNNLNDIVFEKIKPMHPSVLKRFSNIAYHCLKESRDDRPEMAEVVRELESALNIHELLQNEEFLGKWNEQLYEYQEMIKTAEPTLNYKSEDELMDLMSKGVILNGGKTYFSLNKKGEHHEMISIAECMGSEFKKPSWPKYVSRFAAGTYVSNHGIFNTCVKAQFLSPGITYTVNLVFKFSNRTKRKGYELISLKYKLQEEAKSSVSHLAYEREDGWLTAELYQFTSDRRSVKLQILFDGLLDQYTSIEVDGIEFQPLEKVEHVDVKQPTVHSDANWEEKLPINDEDITKRAENSLQWTTKEEAYSIIRKTFSISDDKAKNSIWFPIDKDGKKCHMLSAALLWRPSIYNEELSKMLLPESRFGEAIQFDCLKIHIGQKELKSPLLSSEATYAIYLVYKLPKDQSGFEAPVTVTDSRTDSGDGISYIYLVSPQTPVIRPTAEQNTHNPLSMPKLKHLPLLRNDGWMEVKFFELCPATTLNVHLVLELCDKKKFSGLIIEGIEFRPI